MILRELITKFGFDVDSKKIEDIDNSIEGTKKKLDKLAQGSTRIGRSLTTFVTLPILGLGAALVKTASDAEETESKFNTVFDGIGGKANATAKTLARDFGLSSTKAKQLLGDTGDLLTGFGFAQDSALDLSKGVQELAVDLASFTNFSGGAEGASKALTKALLGERESIKSLGISILEEDVKARVLLNTQKGLTFETERQAKAYATLQLAQEQSKNAIGDFARTSDGFANRWRVMLNRVEEGAIAFGKILLPPALKVLNVFIKMIEFVSDLSDTTKTLVLILLGLVAVIGPILLGFGALLGILSPMILGFTGLATAIGITKLELLKLAAIFVLKAALIAAALAIVFLVIDDLIAFFKGEDSLTGVIIEEMGKAADAIGEMFNGLPEIARAALALVTAPIRAVFASVQALGGALGALTQGDFSGALDAISEGVKNTFDFDTITKGGLGGLFGFGAPEPAGAVNATQTANADVTVNVPPGTSPEEAGEIVKTGVSEGLLDVLQGTQRQVSSPIVE